MLHVVGVRLAGTKAMTVGLGLLGTFFLKLATQRWRLLRSWVSMSRSTQNAGVTIGITPDRASAATSISFI